MTAGVVTRPRLLVVGGCGGLVGRAVLREFAPTHEIRSIHRRLAPMEAAAGVEWIQTDAAEVEDWTPWLRGVDVVLTLAWYRQARRRRFSRLAGGLLRLVRDADRVGLRRYVQVSVPDAPTSLEAGLPYLSFKRDVDRALASSRLDFSIVRPSMLFGERDKLLTVMLRTIHRYHRLPLFGDGEYHLSPLAVDDLARILRRESEFGGRRTVDAGGPVRLSYLELAGRLFAALHRPPKYLRFSARGGVRLARFLEAVGSTLLYAYEVEWLLADRLGLPPYEGLGASLNALDPFLQQEAARLTAP